jgi:hypothetical protein
LSCLLRWSYLLPHHLHHIIRQAVIIPFGIVVEIIAHAHSREMDKISVVDPDSGVALVLVDWIRIQEGKIY